MRVRAYLRGKIQDAAMMLIAFLLGRITVFNGMMPFGIPFILSVYGCSRLLIVSEIGMAIGILSTGVGIKHIANLTALIAIDAAIFMSKRNITPANITITACISLFSANIILACFEGLLFYDVLMAGLETGIVFVLSSIFRSAAAALCGLHEKKTVSGREVISIAALVSAVAAGLYGERIFGISLTDTAGIFLILMFGFKYGMGAGAASGAVTGLMSSVVLEKDPVIIGVYSFCGLMTGVFSKYTRFGAALGFMLGNSVMMLYLNGAVENLILIQDIVSAALAFFLIPKRFFAGMLEWIERFSAAGFADKWSYAKRVKDIVLTRLKQMTTVFNGISRAMLQVCAVRETADRKEIMFVFDRAAEKICKDCSRCLVCWERNFHDTYSIMVDNIKKLEDNGHLKIDDLPDYFRNSCIRPEQLISSINNSYEIYRVGVIWKGKMNESRYIILKQFESISKVMTNLMSEINSNVNFNEDIEHKMADMLCENGIYAEDIIAYRDENSRLNIIVCGNEWQAEAGIDRRIAGIASECVGKKMMRVEKADFENGTDTWPAMRFIEQERFGVAVGVSRIAKGSNSISGDNFTFKSAENGRYIIALSDGMGTGMMAEKESACALNLLEQLLESGFDSGTSADMINSMLMIGHDGESFATLDLAVLDLYEGWVNFTKRGAVPSYIMHEDGSIDVVETVSAPAGILPDVDHEDNYKLLKDEDYIIFMTDGVYESIIDGTGQDDWVYIAIKQSRNVNPQKFADAIMEKASKNSGGNPADDMLVIVAKIWERV